MKISNCYLKYEKTNFELNIPKMELQDNKINCLLGDNGSGKSTLLKQIVTDNCQHDIKSKILMLQKPFIFAGTVEDNINKIQKLSKNIIQDKEQILADLMLLDLRKQRAKSLSGGQKQRLAFAMAILSDCDLIMLDEPFNNIDLKSQHLMVALMKRLDKTFLLVSHKIQLSRKIGDYFFLIDEGKLIVEGEKEVFFIEENNKVMQLLEME
ncbi:energy-coupling factor ABC transporter ATP-binding protein [Erysipelotrichaceae bacterium OttesenSCG-928-M19]|nr:energy-coupling factor ABC transporter ATP-binding protein [Erysipelotrichaceae bacterium OttesenSCG-928-M19]